MQWIQLMILTSMAGGFFSRNIRVLLKAFQKERKRALVYSNNGVFDKKKLWQEDFLPRPNKRDNSFRIYFCWWKPDLPQRLKNCLQKFIWIPSFQTWQWHKASVVPPSMKAFSRVSEESFLFSLSFFLSSLPC